MFRSLFRVHGNLNRLNRTTQTSSFHTTTPTPINPLVGILARFGARFAGRQLKTKYDALPLAERKRLKRYVKGDEGANALHATGVAFALCGVGWYVAHLETNPVTGRTRYLTATRADIAALALEQTIELVEEYEAAQLLYKPNHRTYKQVQEITNNLIAALEYLPELKQLVDEQEEFIDWELHVVKSEQQNAFVLPTGKIFVYDGIIQMCRDEAALAAVLAHEMSHAILEHTREKHSSGNGPILTLKILMTLGTWGLGMDLWASLFLERINDWVVEMVAELPYSRLLENEADAIGLEIAAAACYDSTHASEFWKRHALAHEVEDKNVKKVNEYLSTHPLSSNRSEIIANRTHEMQQLSEDCGCGSKLKKKLLYSLTRHARK